MKTNMVKSLNPPDSTYSVGISNITEKMPQELRDVMAANSEALKELLLLRQRSVEKCSDLPRRNVTGRT